MYNLTLKIMLTLNTARQPRDSSIFVGSIQMHACPQHRANMTTCSTCAQTEHLKLKRHKSKIVTFIQIRGDPIKLERCRHP